MNKRKSEGGKGQDDLEPSGSKKVHRTGSSSSSNSEEWLCASTKVPLPEETFGLPQFKCKRKPTSLAKLPNSAKAAAGRLSTACSTPSTSDGSILSHGVHTASCTPLRSYSKLVSSELHSFAKRTKSFKVRRTSSPAYPMLKASPLFRKASDITSPEAPTKWPSFSSTRRKNVVLELDAVPSTSDEHSEMKPCSSTDGTMLVEESPLKTDTGRSCERSPSPSLRKCVNSVVADSQRSSRSLKTRSLENTRLGMFHKIPAKKELTWPTSLDQVVKSTTTPKKDKQGACGSSATTEIVLESSPDEKLLSFIAAKPTVSSAETKSSVSTDVVAATQELFDESDEEDQPMSESFDIDEVTRLVPSHSAEKKEKDEEDSEEEESSSDEDDELSRSAIAKMNLSGKALEFAEYMLARRSERLMIKRDPNVATETFEVIRTASAWGMSVSWLSPKAIMYAPPFSRDPSTVTLALPLLKIPNKYDPEMPLILNPIIVSTTQEPTAAESGDQ